MTTCREAKQGMRRDQDNWDGWVKTSKGQGAWKILGLRLGSPGPFVLPSRPGLGTALGCEWYEAGAGRINSFLLSPVCWLKELHVLN